MYDYLIVGARLFGAVCARELTDAGKSVLVIEKRPHIAGNVYTEKIEGISVHKYGAHIFHTNSKEVWDYVNNQFLKILKAIFAILKMAFYAFCIDMRLP